MKKLIFILFPLFSFAQDTFVVKTLNTETYQEEWKKLPWITGTLIPAVTNPQPVVTTVNLTSTSVDFYPSIQAAINANCKPNGGLIELTPGKIYRESNITIPNFSSGYKPQFWIRGNGATIIGTNIFTKFTGGQTDGETQVNSTLIIQGLRFFGEGKGYGVKIQSSYSTEISHCSFQNFDIGLNLQFCMAAKISQCDGQGNNLYDFLIQQGVWQGSTTSNSSSNQTVLEQCRSYCKQGQLAAIKLIASSGIVIRDCIIEGWNPVRGIDYDVQQSTTTKLFKVENLHLECAPTEAGIYLNPWGGTVIIDRLWTTLSNFVLIQSAPTAQGHIIIDNLPYIPEGGTFKGDAGMWYFKNLNWQVDAGGVKFDKFYKNHWQGPVPYYKSIQLDNGLYDNGEGK